MARLRLMSSAAEPLRDGHGRLIGDLRVSVTDRCNFRCQYCMPAEGLPWLDRRGDPHASRRSSGSCGCSSPMGVTDVRLTGGEPLVRRELPELVAMLSADRGPRGPLADDQRLPARAHGRRPRRGGPAAHQRLARLALARPLLPDHAARLAAAGDRGPRGARALSASSARSRSTASRCAASPRRRSLPFAELARRKPYQVRFIEFMPLDADHAWSEDRVLTGAEIRAMIDRGLSARAAGRASRTRPRGSTASATAAARSGSSTRSPSRSARTATASA